MFYRMGDNGYWHLLPLQIINRVCSTLLVRRSFSYSEILKYISMREPANESSLFVNIYFENESKMIKVTTNSMALVTSAF